VKHLTWKLFAIASLAVQPLLIAECQEDCLRTKTSPCCNIYFNADYLYWRACPDGVFTGIDSFAQASPNEGGVPLESFFELDKVKAANKSFDSGFRLGVGYQPECSNWDATVKWTHFENDDSNSISLGDGTTMIIPYRTAFLNAFNLVGFATTIDKLQGHWDLKLNLVDVELAKHLQLGECFFFRPHVGLRFANIDQQLRTVATGTIEAVGNDDLLAQPMQEEMVDFRTVNRFKDEFTGFGPRFGFDTRVELGCCFGFYADLAAAFLYGEREASVRLKGARASLMRPRNLENLTDDDFHQKGRNDKHCTRIATDAAIGLYWSQDFCDNCYTFIGKIGWEHHFFFGQGVGESITNGILVGNEDQNLSTQGLTVSAGLVY